MKFVFTQSLKDEALNAIEKGVGKHGKFAVDKVGHQTFIALIKNGRAQEWVQVINNQNKPIEAVERV